MSVYDDMRSFARRIELLAPAGRWDVLEAVVAAGADAVYLSPRRFNMRMHRSDFHFTPEQLADAVDFLHARGRRIHVAVNALVGELELPELRDTLVWLDGLGADAIIVQDLATIRVAREIGLHAALHASTMMNVHGAMQARVLRSLGISRIIASRDIDVRRIGEIGRLADIETECFAHGDMCVAQSGQCTLSGVVLGKSANRGQCMKPCRWEYELLCSNGDGEAVAIREGHLLAIKDLCLIRQIPDVIQTGVCSLKIEGRMRDGEYLGRLVGGYRQAIDAYYVCPPAYGDIAAIIEDTYRAQIRPLSTLTLLGGSSSGDCFDPSGRREPLFLGNGAPEAAAPEQGSVLETLAPLPGAFARPALAVSVATPLSARAALTAGAERLYVSAEIPQAELARWSLEEWTDVLARAREQHVRVGLRTPRITTDREWSEMQWLLDHLDGQGFDYALVHHLGTLRLLRESWPHVAVIADHGFNLLNNGAASVLAQLGVHQITPVNEAGWEDIVALASPATLPLELIVHGPVTGMLIEHCVIALHASPSGRKDVCRGPCRHATFALRDRSGEVREIVPDRHCRNHLLTSHDLGCLPWIERFCRPAVGSVRIEAQFYPTDLVEVVTQAYRLKLDSLAAGGDDDGTWQDAWRRVCDRSPRPLNLGPYARSIIHARSTAEVLKTLAGQ